MTWSLTRFLIYIIGIALSAFATFTVAKGWATYDSVTNTLDPHPINLTTLAASLADTLVATPLFLPFLMPLLEEKLASSHK